MIEDLQEGGQGIALRGGERAVEGGLGQLLGHGEEVAVGGEIGQQEVHLARLAGAEDFAGAAEF